MNPESAFASMNLTGPLPVLHVIKVLTKDYVVDNERSFARVHGFGVPRLTSDARLAESFGVKKIRSYTSYKRFSGVCVRLLGITGKKFWCRVGVSGCVGRWWGFSWCVWVGVVCLVCCGACLVYV